MKITWSGFRGENRALHPLLLPDGVGTLSLNQNPVRGDMRPWKSPLTVATVPAGRQTIYRMGRDVKSDAQYWLSWPSVVHAVRGMVAEDTTERTYFTGDGFPKWTDNTMALTTAPYPTAWRQLGLPRPATAALLVASGGVSTLVESRYYTYTYISDKGEEGEPAPVSLVLTCKPDAVVAISSLAAPPAGSYGIDRIRIYRTQSGLTGAAEFFFLREIASSLTSSTDDGRTLGEVLPSTTWLAPPANLSYLTALWNGMLAGISDGVVRFCEAYKPYAWPIAYDVVVPDAKAVALGVFGQNLLVLTTGRPQLVTGASPESMDSQALTLAEACVAPLSVVSFGHGVAWACPDGLAYYGAGGARIVTTGLMTRDDWQAIKPESIVASVYEGAYLGFYTVAGVTQGFLIDPLNPAGLYFMELPAKALFFDELQDALYLLDGVNIKKWDSGSLQTASCKSKQYRSPKPVNFACAEVTADSYPLTFKLYADGVLKHTQSVAGAAPFRLPAGYLASIWQMELASTGAVQGVAMAESMQEISLI